MSYTGTFQKGLEITSIGKDQKEMLRYLVTSIKKLIDLITQMYQIRKDLESGLDVSLYADPKFAYNQMEQIRRGLKKYADDPLIDRASANDILRAYKRRLPLLAYLETL